MDGWIDMKQARKKRKLFPGRLSFHVPSFLLTSNLRKREKTVSPISSYTLLTSRSSIYVAWSSSIAHKYRYGHFPTNYTRVRSIRIPNAHLLLFCGAENHSGPKVKEKEDKMSAF